MKDNRIERYATAAIVIGSIIGTLFFSRPRKGSLKTRLGRKLQRSVDRNLTTPANATFGIIWPAIYAGTISLAIHQALPSQRNNPRYEKAQPWLQLNYLLGAMFGYFFSKSDKKSRIASSLITISMLPAAIGLHRQLGIGQGDVPQPENTFRKFISVYTGWLTAASAVSITSLVQDAGYFKKSDEAVQWTNALLPITGGIGILASRRLNDPYYLLALIAAFAGIAVKQKDKNSEISVLAAGLASTLIGFFVTDLKKQLEAGKQTIALS